MPEENRLSLKWIDGNDVVTLSGGTYTEPVDVHINGNTAGIPTFDVDNPTMWTPLSVISGRASGFCERRAVLDSEFKTGASTSKTWLQNDDTSAAIADRAAIVSNCMHNLALGSDYAHLFYSSGANAIMAPIGSAAVSNYMTAMDSAITAIVSGTNVYVDENGSSYESTGRAAFDGLASSAYITASAQSATGSSILRPSSGGGSSLKTTMAIGLPVEWAKERKWMLDELKYTGGGAASGYTSATWRLRENVLLTSNDIVNVSGISAAVSSYLTSNYTNAAYGWDGYNTTVLTFTRSSGAATTYTIGSSWLAYGLVARWIDQTVHTPVNIYVVPAAAWTDGVWFSPNYFSSSTASSGYILNIKTYNSGAYTEIVPADAIASKYLLLSGATVTFTTAQGVVSNSLDVIDIQSGATAYIDIGEEGLERFTEVSAANVMQNGKLAIISGGSEIIRSSGSTYRTLSEGFPIYCYHRYQSGDPYYDGGWGAGKYMYISGGAVTSLPVWSDSTPFGLYVFGADNGANAVTVSFNSSHYEDVIQVAQIESGCSVTITGSRSVMNAVTVQPGAKLEISAGTVQMLTVQDSGTAIIHGYCDYLQVYSGAIVTISGSTAKVNHLTIEDGAVVNITADTVINGTICNLVTSDGDTSSSVVVANVEVDLFHPIQFVGLSRGWNNSLSVTSETLDSIRYGRYYGSAYNTAMTTITSSISAALADNPIRDIQEYSATNLGSSHIGGTTYNGYSVFALLSSCTVVYGARVRAFYPVADLPGGITSHYDDFYVRQFPTQAEIDRAISSATTT